MDAGELFAWPDDRAGLPGEPEVDEFARQLAERLNCALAVGDKLVDDPRFESDDEFVDLRQ